MKSFEPFDAFTALVPLAEAVLCMDCDRISQQRGRHSCAGCGSSHLINLAAVLNPVRAGEAGRASRITPTQS